MYTLPNAASHLGAFLSCAPFPVTLKQSDNAAYRALVRLAYATSKIAHQVSTSALCILITRFEAKRGTFDKLRSLCAPDGN
jgi:hypothetical protein